MFIPAPLPPDASARERILQTAQDLFYQQGIRATGVDTLIAHSRVTKATFYRHFPSKQDVIMAALTARHQHWLHAFQQTLEKMMQNYGTLSQALPQTLLSWFSQSDYRGCLFINAQAEMALSSPVMQTAIRSHKQAMADSIRCWLDKSEQEKTSLLMLLAEGAIVRVQYGEDPRLVTSAMVQAIRFILGESHRAAAEAQEQ